jgi:exopolysaccharide biosynthesis polyprenyl glycosylphosphotransferase
MALEQKDSGFKAFFYVGCVKLAAHILALAAFFLMLGINNPQIIRPSRTALITLSMFVIGFFLFIKVYGGFDIGKRKSKPIIYSFSIAAILADLAAYLQLEIMNVNSAKNAELTLFGGDFALLLACFVIQAGGIAGLAYLGNHLYFMLHKPAKCCVITADSRNFERARARLGKFRLQYEICEQVDCLDPRVKAAIRRSEAVFLFDVPAAQRIPLVEYCYKHKIGVFFTPDLYDILSSSGEVRILDDEMLIGREGPEITMGQRMAKRAADIVLSLAGLVCLAPLMLAVAAAIRISDGGKAVYRQKRMTREGREFYIFKFRTMVSHAENDRQLPAGQGDARVTRLGRHLRRCRLDELPQLLNILRGDMSFVGPRPEMLENVDRYMKELPEFAYRSRMKAGLTGYAQIAGKYNTPPRQKLLMDLYYISNYSLLLDAKLLLKTLLVFFKKDSTQAFDLPKS